MSSRSVSSPRKSANQKSTEQEVAPKAAAEVEAPAVSNQEAQTEVSETPDAGSELMSNLESMLGGASSAFGGDDEEPAETGVDGDVFGSGGFASAAPGGGGGGTGDPIDPTDAADAAAGSSGSTLPTDVADAMGSALGADVSKARVHTGAAAEKVAGGLQAQAVTMGSDIFMGAGAASMGTKGGDELLAHELAHTVAPESGGSGLSVSDPGGSAETAAKTAGAQAAEAIHSGGAGANLGGAATGAKAPSNAVAMREELPGASSETTQAPSSVEFSLGGIGFSARLPAGASPGQVQVDLESPLSNVSLSPATVRFDADWNILGGSVTATASLGAAVQNASGSLTIGPGGSIGGVLSGELVVGSILTGTVRVSMSAEGAVATGTIDSTGIQLPNGFSVDGGSVTVRVGSDGVVNGSGTVSGELPVGRYSLELVVSAEGVSGMMTVPLNPGPITDQVTITSGTVSGTYDGGEVLLDGSIGVDVGGFASGSLQGSYDPIANQFSGVATAQLGSAITTNGVTFESGSVTVNVNQNSVSSVQANLSWSTSNFNGSVNGSMDLGTQVVNGTGTASLTTELDLGGGTTLQSAEGTATITDGALVSVTGAATAQVAFKGEPTFQAVLDGVALDPQALTMGGTATITTLRELSFGAGSATVTVASGASCSGTIADNELTNLDGGLEFTVSDEAGDFGFGLLVGSLAGGELSGSLDFELTTDYGFPERSSTGSVLMAGGTASMTMEAGSLSEANFSIGYRYTDEDSGGCVEANATGTWNLDTKTVDGSATGQLVTEWPLESAVGTLVLQPGGSVTATLEAGALTSIAGNFGFTSEINASTPIHLEGTIDGSLDAQAGLLTGTATAILSEEIVFNAEADGEGMEGWSPVILAGSSITIGVEENSLTDAEVNVGGVVRSPEGDIATATIAGTMDLTDPVNGFSGTATATTNVDLPWYEGPRFSSVLMSGGTATVNVVEGSPTDASGLLGFRLDESGAEAASLMVDGNWTRGAGISGEAAGNTTADIEVYASGDDRVLLTSGSAFDMTMTSDAPETIHGDLGLRLDDAEGELAEGYITADWSVDGDGVLSGSGDLTLGRDLEVGDGGSRFTPVVKAESTAGAVLTDSQLDTLDGTLDTRVDEGDRPVVEGSVVGNYTHATEEFGGSGSAEVIDEIDPQVQVGGYSFFVTPGSGSTANIEASELKVLDGTVNARVDDNEGELLNLELGGSFDAVEKVFDGEATADFARRKELATEGEYTVYGETGTEAAVTVTQNTLSNLDGTIEATIEDGDGLLLEASGAGMAELGDAPVVDLVASASIVREKEMGGLGGRYSFTLMPGAGAEVNVVQNVVESYGGTLTVRVDDDGEELALIELIGSYSEGEGFSGTGAATLLVDEYEAANMGDFTLVLMAGTGAEITVENDNLVEMSANIPVGIQKSGEAFMTGQLDGAYQFEDEMFSGNGSLAVVADEMLLPFGDSEFWLDEGSNGSVEVVENNLTGIGGGINLSLREAGDPYLQIMFQGQYDMEGGTGFTGGGAGTVLREKRLFEGDAYAFAIMEGSGAETTIVENELTSLAGNIPFRVYDGEGALVDGHVEGNWDKETGHVSGAGSVFLARDVEYGPVKVLAGSGGEGTVEESVLKEFTGQLGAVLSDDEGELATLTAEGTFDAENNEIVELEGGVVLNRALEPVPGIIISDVSGEGRIEHNEIKRVEGAGTVLVEAVGVEGSFEAGWRKDGDKDVYWGTAVVGQVEMDHDMGNDDRGISNAMIEAELHEDETFDLHGSLDYNITESIGGSLDVEMDEGLDPVLGGTLESEGTLLDEMNLFEKEFNLVPSMTVWAGPIPITFGVAGGVSAGLQALQYDFSVGVAGFHILDMNVPELTGAHFGLDWGADFEAYIAPFVGIGFDYSVFSLMAGLEGQVIASVPVDIGIDASLYGGGDEFYGDLAVGASISPSVELQLNAFAEATLLDYGGEWDFEVGSYTFDDLFTVEWGTTYQWGDRQGSTADSGPVTPSTDAGGTTALELPGGEVSEGSQPSLGLSGQSNTGEGEAGLSVSGDDLDLPMGGGSGFDNPLGDYADEFEALQAGAAAIGTIVDLVGINPLTAPLAVYNNWDALCAAVDDIVEALAAAGRLLRDLMPDWVNTLIEWVEEGISAVADFFGDAWDSVTGAIGDAAEAVGDAWDAGVDWVSSWF